MTCVFARPPPGCANMPGRGEEMPEDLKRYVVVWDPLRERLRRPSLERSPTAALAQMYFRGSGGELTRRALLDVPVAVRPNSGRAPAWWPPELARGPAVRARAGTRVRRRLHRSALGDPGSLDDYDVEILASRPDDLTLIRASERTAQALREAGVTLVDDAPVYTARARPPSVRRRRRPWASADEDGRGALGGGPQDSWGDGDRTDGG